jgi:hypothetical protein
MCTGSYSLWSIEFTRPFYVYNKVSKNFRHFSISSERQAAVKHSGFLFQILDNSIKGAGNCKPIRASVYGNILQGCEHFCHIKVVIPNLSSMTETLKQFFTFRGTRITKTITGEKKSIHGNTIHWLQNYCQENIFIKSYDLNKPTYIVKNQLSCVSRVFGIFRGIYRSFKILPKTLKLFSGTLGFRGTLVWTYCIRGWKCSEGLPEQVAKNSIWTREGGSSRGGRRKQRMKSLTTVTSHQILLNNPPQLFISSLSTFSWLFSAMPTSPCNLRPSR